MILPFAQRSLFAQLLGGGLLIIAGVVITTFLISHHFQEKVRQATFRRAEATTMALAFRQLNEVHQKFMDTEQFIYEDSTESPALAGVQRAVRDIRQAADTLQPMLDGEPRAACVRIRGVLVMYSTALTKFLTTLKAHGLVSQGAAMAWNTNFNALLTLGGPLKLSPLVMRLGNAQSYARNTPVAPGVNWLDSVATLRTLVRRRAAQAGVPRSSELMQRLDRADSLFQVMYTLQLEMGRNDTEGLRSTMHRALLMLNTTIQPFQASMVRKAKAAEMRDAVALPVVLLIGVIVAVMFLYAFAASVSKTTSRISDAAIRLGHGDLSVRVDVPRQKELRDLAEAFNHMTDNLSVLITAVRQSGDRINTSTNEMAATSRQQHVTASEVAATTHQVSATAHAISNTSQELAQNIQRVLAVTERTAALATSGHSGLERMKQTMQHITDASGTIHHRFMILNERARAITHVITTIAKVADQINLLSLNAAIEAEKAGDYGLGFAVVAAEIRRLADQTASATTDIDRIITEMQSSVTSGMTGMDKFATEVRVSVVTSHEVERQLSEIIEQVQTLPPSFEQVSIGAQSQAEGAQQISEALAQLRDSVQQTVESLQQFHLTIEQLNDTSERLYAGISRFSIAV